MQVCARVHAHVCACMCMCVRACTCMNVRACVHERACVMCLKYFIQIRHTDDFPSTGIPASYNNTA